MDNLSNYVKYGLKLGITEFSVKEFYESKDITKLLTHLSSLYSLSKKQTLEPPDRLSTPSPNGNRKKSLSISKSADRTLSLQCADSLTLRKRSATGSSTQNNPFRSNTQVKASVSNLDDDLATKEEFKYVPELEEKAIIWIEALLKEKFPAGSFMASLKSGVILCKVLNAIKPGTVSKIYEGPIHFKQMENINSFLEGCKRIGMPENNLFITSDLYEEKNLSQVLSTIHLLGKFVSKIEDYNGPVIESSYQFRNLYSSSLVGGSFPDSETNNVEVRPEHQELVDWINSKMQNRLPKIRNLTSDLRSGVHILTLLEIVTRMDYIGVFERKPRELWHYMQNDALILRFLSLQTFEKFEGCTATDIVMGREEQIANLVKYIRDKFDLNFLFMKILKEEEDYEKVSHMSPEEMVLYGFGHFANDLVTDKKNLRKAKEDELNKSRLSSLESLDDQLEEEVRLFEENLQMEKEILMRPFTSRKSRRKSRPRTMKLNNYQIVAKFGTVDPNTILKNPPQTASVPNIVLTEDQKEENLRIKALRGSKKNNQKSMTVKINNSHSEQETKDKKEKERDRNSLPRDDSKIARLLKAQNTVRQKVANELLQTEQSYIFNLSTLYQKLVKPLKDAHILSSSEEDSLFSNVSQILENHQVLVKKLESRIKSPSEDFTLGDIFLSNLHYIRDYEPYCRNYTRSMVFYHHLIHKHPKLAQLINMFEASEPTLTTSLTGILIMPVQRIPRYVLLLKDLHKYTSPDHKDHEGLQLALSKIQEVLDSINARIDQEETSRYSALLNIIDNVEGDQIKGIVTPNSRVLREGTVDLKVTPITSTRSTSIATVATAWNNLVHRKHIQAHCFLLNSHLLVCNLREEIQGTERPYLCQYPLSLYEITSIVDKNKKKESRSLVLHLYKEKWKLSFASSAESSAWAATISAVLSNLRNQM
eukprot:TRINITY_DN2687_c0_g1_i1.p1 TRINITY_DN2687_c0_g1~~TRINITY_DN2687_c0_g1_i1.p1  ORF type:complete len:1007 (+),score=188.05 TRINITY_DN2687_c0_g1_i1:223-3021(+)